MKIGLLSESGHAESRVALTPAACRSLVLRGHDVLVEAGAGDAARFHDEEYLRCGGRIAGDRSEVFQRSDMLLRVSPLQLADAALLRSGQIVLGFHHLAAARRELVEEVLARQATLIGYELVEDGRGHLPVLQAMSEIAGQLAVHVAAHFLETRSGGRGILLGGATGIPPAHVVILGAGVVGTWAARTAAGNGAQVTIHDVSLRALRHAEETLGRSVITEMAEPHAIGRSASYADVLIGAALVRGERSPLLITREMVEGMRGGSVIVDVAIDQGGCVETMRPTTLEQPVFTESGVTHYGVPNMTSAVARTASLAVTHASYPFVQALADEGLELALEDFPGLRAGVYAYRGEMVFPGVARTFGMACQSLGEMIGLTR